MDGSTYDLVVLGTGITETMLSGLCSLEGMRVLHLDKNSFYGDAGASLNATALWQRFRPGEAVPQDLLPNRDWNVDLIPKFIMAYGKLVKMIIKMKVSHYLTWKSVEGSYVYQWQKGGFFSSDKGVIEKIPGNDREALTSNLLSLFEKRRCQSFFQFVQGFDPANAKTWGKHDPRAAFRTLIAGFGLDENTIDFLGHAIALYTSDEFLDQPATEVLERIKLYIDSSGRFGDSHFIYPFYGLAGIPEAFSRKSAVYGGTFMLNVTVDHLELEAKDGMWTVGGVYEGERVSCRAHKVIAAPSYVEAVGRGSLLRSGAVVRRVICILDHAIPGTHKAEAAQIILPQKQTGRRSDIFIVILGPAHAVCKKGYFLAIISGNVEKPSVDEDLGVAFQLIGPVVHRFVTETVIKTPVSRTFTDGLFVTDTLDATSHFESAAENVLELFRGVTGKALDLAITPEDTADN